MEAGNSCADRPCLRQSSRHTSVWLGACSRGVDSCSTLLDYAIRVALSEKPAATTDFTERIRDFIGMLALWRARIIEQEGKLLKECTDAEQARAIYRLTRSLPLTDLEDHARLLLHQQQYKPTPPADPTTPPLQERMNILKAGSEAQVKLALATEIFHVNQQYVKDLLRSHGGSRTQRSLRVLKAIISRIPKPQPSSQPQTPVGSSAGATSLQPKSRDQKCFAVED